MSSGGCPLLPLELPPGSTAQELREARWKAVCDPLGFDGWSASQPLRADAAGAPTAARIATFTRVFKAMNRHEDPGARVCSVPSELWDYFGVTFTVRAGGPCRFFFYAPNTDGGVPTAVCDLGGNGRVSCVLHRGHSVSVQLRAAGAAGLINTSVYRAPSPSPTRAVVHEPLSAAGAGTETAPVPPQGALDAWVGATVPVSVTVNAAGVPDWLTLLALGAPPVELGPLAASSAVDVIFAGAGRARATFDVLIP